MNNDFISSAAFQILFKNQSKNLHNLLLLKIPFQNPRSRRRPTEQLFSDKKFALLLLVKFCQTKK